jgi:hypothetical protein
MTGFDPKCVVRRSLIERQLSPEPAIRSAQSGLAAMRANGGRSGGGPAIPKAANRPDGGKLQLLGGLQTGATGRPKRYADFS